MPASSPAPHRPRVLLIGESLSLCHVTRPLVLAQALDPARYEVHFACRPEYHHLLAHLPWKLHSIESLPSRESLDRVARGLPVFSLDTLRAYVREDLGLLVDLAPDLVVGDMRLSLSVSARLTGTPYLGIASAYWSPYAQQRFDVPELPMTRRLGPWLAGRLFRMALPMAFAIHCRPINRLRREFGLPMLGRDLRTIYTHADYTLYADAAELVPTRDLPANHVYLGPILWSFPSPLPAWWDQIREDRPIVYVSLGSSGRPELLRAVLDALADAPVTVIAATSGRFDPGQSPKNAFVADYLPAEAASARAKLAISHGGSASAYVALARGVPVLGLPSNLDQHLTLDYIERAGAASRLRAEAATPAEIRAAVDRMLAESRYSEAAARMAGIFARYDAGRRFSELVEAIRLGLVSTRAWAS